VTDVRYPWIGKTLHDLNRPVGRGIVDNDELEILKGLI
jgi:hypothetical protein